MAEQQQQNRDEEKRLPWPFIVFLIVILIAILIAALTAAAFGQMANSRGEHTLYSSLDAGATNTIDCSSGANVPAAYRQWVKDAAAKWLGGDEAALITIIQIESSWNPTATPDPSANSTAGGLGQFLTSTAGDMPEFKGGSDGKGKTWTKGTLHKWPRGHSDDARFDPERSIFATAHYMNKGGFPGSRTLGEMYEIHYHGGTTPSQKAAARAARKKVEATYSKVLQNDCKETVTAGKSGQVTGNKACPMASGNPDWGPVRHSNPHVPTYPGHEGLDIGGTRGTEIYSVTDGTVMRVRYSGGWYVWINDEQGHYWFYQHMVANEYIVKPGQKVKAGQLIGHMSNTGAENTIVHLHLGIAKTPSATTGGAGVMKWSEWYYPYDMLHDIPCLNRTLKK